MKGITRDKYGHFIAKYSTEYIGYFDSEEEAIRARRGVEEEKLNSKPSITSGAQFGQFVVIGETGQRTKDRCKTYLVRNKMSGEVKEVIGYRLKNGHTNGKRKGKNSLGTGVSFDKRSGKWAASMMVNRKRVLYKLFPTKQEAIEARKAAEQKYLNK